MGWRNRPKFINYCPSNIDYVLFIDENGSDDMKCFYRNPNAYKSKEELLTVTGVAIRSADLKIIKDTIMSLKNRYWDEGYFDYSGSKKRVCFHSRDIRKRQGPFNPTIVNANQIHQDLGNTIKNMPIKIFSATVDKYEHYLIYCYNPYHPYNLGLNFILERFAKFYLAQNETAIIVIEARGKDKDKFTLNHIKQFLDTGNRYVSSQLLKNKIKGVYFNPKWCKEHNDKKSYFGLEIADLCSYPIYKFVKYQNKDTAFRCFENKIYSYPYYNGRGIKVFP